MDFHPSLSIQPESLRRWRCERLLSQADLADKAGLHVSTVQGIEGGTNKRQRLSTVRRLAEALQVDPSEFVAEFQEKAAS